MGLWCCVNWHHTWKKAHRDIWDEDGVTSQDLAILVFIMRSNFQTGHRGQAKGNVIKCWHVRSLVTKWELKLVKCHSNCIVISKNVNTIQSYSCCHTHTSHFYTSNVLFLYFYNSVYLFILFFLFLCNLYSSISIKF